MVYIAINHSKLGNLKIKDSDGYIVYRNPSFQFIDHLQSDLLQPGLYLIHVISEGKNYYEPLHIVDPASEIKIEIHPRVYR